ncbi:hypothetical protein, partial [Sphaerotilus sp.]|uniref:hypothetical protein n=1 Tax=Sphaerotilus sp. TaxID=2093942 RepID=UPI0034E1D6FA
MAPDATAPLPDPSSTAPHRRAPPWALQVAGGVLLAWLVGQGIGGPSPVAPSAGLWPVAGLSLGLLLRWRQQAWPALAFGWLVGHG